MKLEISKINIGSRQRLELGDLSDLDSMAERDVGLICPIIVHKLLNGYELVDGRRRLAKALALGWTEIEVFEKETLTEPQKNLCEFFADVGRKDRTWQEIAITTSKLYDLLRFSKREAGETWPLKSMAKFCGTNVYDLSYRIRIAEVLSVEPHDEEMWNCENMFSATKLLVARANKETEREKERRRLRAIQAAVPSITEEVPLLTEFEESSPSLVSNANSTAAPISDESAMEVVIKVHGINRELTDEYVSLYPLVLSYGGPSCAADYILDGGYGVIFCEETGLFALDMELREYLTLAPSPLVWNRITPPEKSVWPIYTNYLCAILFRRSEPTEPVEAPHSGVFNSIQFEDGYIDRSVVSALVERLSQPGQSVLCVGGIKPLHVAETGRVPIFFEPNKEKFGVHVAELKEYYESTVPFAKVEVPV